MPLGAVAELGNHGERDAGACIGLRNREKNEGDNRKQVDLFANKKSHEIPPELLL
jgi:hypothetical protein